MLPFGQQQIKEREYIYMLLSLWIMTTRKYPYYTFKEKSQTTLTTRITSFPKMKYHSYKCPFTHKKGILAQTIQILERMEKAILYKIYKIRDFDARILGEPICITNKRKENK